MYFTKRFPSTTFLVLLRRTILSILTVLLVVSIPLTCGQTAQTQQEDLSSESSTPQPTNLLKDVSDQLTKFRNPFHDHLTKFSSLGCWSYNNDDSCGPSQWHTLVTFRNSSAIAAAAASTAPSSSSSGANATTSKPPHTVASLEKEGLGVDVRLPFFSCADKDVYAPLSITASDIDIDWLLKPIASTSWKTCGAGLSHFSFYMSHRTSKRLIALQPKNRLGGLPMFIHPNSGVEYILSHILIKAPSEHGFGQAIADLEVQLVHEPRSKVQWRGGLASLEDIMSEVEHNSSKEYYHPLEELMEDPSKKKDGSSEEEDTTPPPAFQPLVVVSRLFRTTNSGYNHGMASILDPILANVKYQQKQWAEANLDAVPDFTVTDKLNTFYGPVDFAKVLLSDGGDYFHYTGQLTMPPCTHNTEYFIMADWGVLSEKQITNFLRHVFLANYTTNNGTTEDNVDDGGGSNSTTPTSPSSRGTVVVTPTNIYKALDRLFSGRSPLMLDNLQGGGSSSTVQDSTVSKRRIKRFRNNGFAQRFQQQQRVALSGDSKEGEGKGNETTTADSNDVKKVEDLPIAGKLDGVSLSLLAVSNELLRLTPFKHVVEEYVKMQPDSSYTSGALALSEALMCIAASSIAGVVFLLRKRNKNDETTDGDGNKGENKSGSDGSGGGGGSSGDLETALGEGRSGQYATVGDFDIGDQDM